MIQRIENAGAAIEEEEGGRGGGLVGKPLWKERAQQRGHGIAKDVLTNQGRRGKEYRTEDVWIGGNQRQRKLLVIGVSNQLSTIVKIEREGKKTKFQKRHEPHPYWGKTEG